MCVCMCVCHYRHVTLLRLLRHVCCISLELKKKKKKGNHANSLIIDFRESSVYKSINRNSGKKDRSGGKQVGQACTRIANCLNNPTK